MSGWNRLVCSTKCPELQQGGQTGTQALQPGKPRPGRVLVAQSGDLGLCWATEAEYWESFVFGVRELRVTSVRWRQTG